VTELLDHRRGNPAVVFSIGRALKGNIDAVRGRLFSTNYDFAASVSLAERAVKFHDAQLAAARAAALAWSLVGIRLRVVKDIRIVIAKLIWAGRNRADYDVYNEVMD
jgi:hypothetical protein